MDVHEVVSQQSFVVSAILFDKRVVHRPLKPEYLLLGRVRRLSLHKPRTHDCQQTNSNQAAFHTDLSFLGLLWLGARSHYAAIRRNASALSGKVPPLYLQRDGDA